MTVDEPSAVDQLIATWDVYQGLVDTKYDRFVEELRASFEGGGDRVLADVQLRPAMELDARRAANRSSRPLARVGQAALVGSVDVKHGSSVLEVRL